MLETEEKAVNYQLGRGKYDFEAHASLKLQTADHVKSKLKT